MRVLAACSLGGAGHLSPLLPYLAAAKAAGHETLLIGPPALADLVATACVSFWPGGEPAEDDIAPIREQLPVAPPAEASVLGNRELFGRLAARAMLPEMERACREWGPDLVLRDPCEYASAALAPRRSTRTVQVAISLAEGEAASIEAASPALEELRPGLTDEVLASPYLTSFPASLDPSPFPETIRCRQAPGPSPDPLPDWWEGNDEPLVYLTFGTVLGHMTIAAGLYRTALDAVAGLDARVLLTVGRHFDPSLLGPLPPNVHVERWVDQARALRDAALVVCHGGSGTTFGAMSAGVPVVVVPSFADQFENGRRVTAAGAGRTVAATTPATAPGVASGQRRPVDARDAPRIKDAIGDVLANNAYRHEAQRLAAEMAATATMDEVLADLLRS